jgi:hypothetical protein
LRTAKITRENKNGIPGGFRLTLRPEVSPTLVHVGGDEIIYSESIVAILHKSAVETSRDTQDAVEVVASEGRATDVSSGTPEAFIFTSAGVILCPVTPPTLRKRITGTE